MMADAGGTATREVPDPVHGVSLDRYAGVIAGLSDGVPLPDVLGNEGVDPDTWPDAEERWQERLIDDESGALQAHFDARLAEAQDRYGRAIAPLDDEVTVWLDFVRRFASADAPLAFVAALGLRGTDVLRLHRRWARRMADDPQIATAAQTALAREPGVLPPLILGERSIRPPERRPATAQLVDHAASAEAAPRAAASEPDDAPASSPSERPSAPPFFAPLSSDEVEPPAEVAEPRADALEPRVSTPVWAPAPIAPATAPEPLPPPLAAPTTRTAAPPPFAAAVAPPLPFAERAAPSETARRPAAFPAAPPRPFDSTIAQDALPPELLRRIADAQLPFARAATVPPPSEAEPSTLAPQQSPFKKAALPFAPSASEPARPAAPRPTDSALPFRSSAPAPTPAPAVAPPPAPTAPLAPMAPLPTLTLDQYASMCAELAVFSDRQQAIFTKYGLADAPRRAAFDAAWKERLKRYPSERAEWDRRYWQYEASWRRTRR